MSRLLAIHRRLALPHQVTLDNDATSGATRRKITLPVFALSAGPRTFAGKRSIGPAIVEE